LTEISLTTNNESRPLSWSADGKWLVTDGLTLISTETGEASTLTSPPTKSSPDFSPAVSPDGRTVAFFRGVPYASSIYLLDLTEDFKPKGEPRRLTSAFGVNPVAAWAPNGREIIFGAFGFGKGSSLWKIQTSSGTGPEQLPFSTGQACCPTISRSGDRLAYQRILIDVNIWRLSLSVQGVAAGPPARFIASTREDSAPQYSPRRQEDRL